MELATYANDVRTLDTIDDGWKEPSVQSLRIHFFTVKEEDGTYSTVALNLPGAGSCGDTRDESIENAKEAVEGCIESYREHGEIIPWRDPKEYTIPECGFQKWIILNV